MQSSAHLEWKCEHCGILRVYEGGRTFERRDRYVWAATANWIDPKTMKVASVADGTGTIEIGGVCKKLLVEHRRVVGAMLSEVGGIERVVKQTRHGLCVLTAPEGRH